MIFYIFELLIFFPLVIAVWIKGRFCNLFGIPIRYHYGVSQNEIVLGLILAIAAYGGTIYGLIYLFTHYHLVHV